MRGKKQRNMKKEMQAGTRRYNVTKNERKKAEKQEKGKKLEGCEGHEKTK